MKKLALMTLGSPSFARCCRSPAMWIRAARRESAHARARAGQHRDHERSGAASRRSLDAIRDNDRLLESTWKLTLSILLFTAIEFTIIAILLVLVFREIRRRKAQTPRVPKRVRELMR